MEERRIEPEQPMEEEHNMAFKEIQPQDLQDNVFTLIGKDWLVVCGEKDGKANAMTASWGGMGVLWGKPVVFIFIRPQRYTKEFVDGADGFTLSVLDESKRKVLNYLGTVSGRDEEMKPECFIERECDAKWYPEKDYHTMYVAEIEKVLVRG